jgi:capsule polysaccharide export protein KpsC/LpsZ
MSLKYGKSEMFTTQEMLDAARNENPGAALYLKIHPDVLNGLKQSDIDVSSIHNDFVILDQDVNAVSLLKQMDKIYTKTSQMGFEALLLNKEVVCFGIPFYAGWGLTDDRIRCERRDRVVSVIELFAAAYILYPVYYNPYTQKPSNLLDVLHTIVNKKHESK